MGVLSEPLGRRCDSDLLQELGPPGLKGPSGGGSKRKARSSNGSKSSSKKTASKS